jgi:hypothetical protein
MDNKLVQILVTALVTAAFGATGAMGAVYWGYGNDIKHLREDVNRHNVNERQWLSIKDQLVTKDDLFDIKTSINDLKWLIAGRQHNEAMAKRGPTEYLKGAQPRRRP